MNGIVIVAVISLIGQSPAKEDVLSARLVSASLFKTGLAFVSGEIQLPGAGTFLLSEVPRAVHGTFWIESPAGIKVNVGQREIEEETRNEGSLLLDANGQEVIVTLKGDRDAIRGKLVLARPRPPSTRSIGTGDLSPYIPLGNQYPPAGSGEHLVIDTKDGRVYLQRSEIVQILVPQVNDNSKAQRPVLVLSSSHETASTVRFHYLARGLGWAPSYQVDISDPARLGLRQSAVVLNELLDFADADLSLITGYPSIELAKVTSPFVPGMTWQSFFEQLTARNPDYSSSVMSNRVMSQMRVPSSSDDFPEGPATGEEVDLHFEPIGKQTLKLGESMVVSTADQPADYERIVEWKVPSSRQESGNPIIRSRSEDEDDPDKAEAWDALRFRNPLPFPLTTGPAMIVKGDQFLGQRLLSWANPNETMVLRINKALSVDTSYVEFENELQQQPLIAYGRERYRKPTVTGKLEVKSGRSEPITMVIHGVCFGELKAASDNPTVRLAERSGYSINKRHELTWTIALPPGSAKEVTYQYDVMVPQ